MEAKTELQNLLAEDKAEVGNLVEVKREEILELLDLITACVALQSDKFKTADLRVIGTHLKRVEEQGHTVPESHRIVFAMRSSRDLAARGLPAELDWANRLVLRGNIEDRVNWSAEDGLMHFGTLVSNFPDQSDERQADLQVLLAEWPVAVFANSFLKQLKDAGTSGAENPDTATRRCKLIIDTLAKIPVQREDALQCVIASCSRLLRGILGLLCPRPR